MIFLDRPRDHDDHTVADFFELLCLVNMDRQISTDTLRDFIDDNRGNKTFQLTDNQLNDVLGQIGWRIEAFADWYPFRLTNSDRVLQAEDLLTDNQKRYISLLACGNLPFFPRANRQALTDFFEMVSGSVLKEMWPSNGQSIIVGKNNTELTGSKADRMNVLGKLLGGNPNIQDSDFRAGDRGDGGIDLAAYLTLDSWEHQNIVAALAQCACSRSDWTIKHGEITNTRLRSLIPSAVPWAELIFTPISFRSNSGKWAVPADVPGVTLIDRLRIVLSLMRLEPTEFQSIPQFVEDLLGYRLDVV
ncbi:hypothetical protein [Croceicoccus marinus]|uniref:Uncharacterized protein n=1 Tax=Croceicoccus marinus TaxID=450378 RepID=A0A7G6VW76_9SPHN|nr:hypothetical protein [Croceicoccus marinus]QNE05991.1 hypothetical protein H4O24_04925 [Croceicoccus marinus]